MKLRPHHLLCTQGYSGKGYDNDFVQNMNAIITRLRNEKAVAIDIVFSTDDICAGCPNMLGIGLCKDNEKVKAFDKKIAEYFGIEEKSYIYRDIISEINKEMTVQIMDYICSECSWYPVSACKSKICNSRNEKNN